MQLAVKTEQHFWRQQMDPFANANEEVLVFLPPKSSNHFIEGIYHAVPLGRRGDKNYFWIQG